MNKETCREILAQLQAARDDVKQAIDDAASASSESKTGSEKKKKPKRERSDSCTIHHPTVFQSLRARRNNE